MRVSCEERATVRLNLTSGLKIDCEQRHKLKPSYSRVRDRRRFFVNHKEIFVNRDHVELKTYLTDKRKVYFEED